MQNTCIQFFRKCLLLLCLVLFTGITANAQVKQYVAKYKSIVAELSEEYGIPVSVVTAISIIESGAGKSRNCRLLNNHFGITGKNNLKKTKGIKSKFKQYDTAEDSFRDFYRMIAKKKYYKKLKGNVNYKPWLDAMAKAGYSTQPETWKKLMTNAIKNYKLDAATK